MYYTMILATTLPLDQPLVFWLAGGPGRSGISELFLTSSLKLTETAEVFKIENTHNGWNEVANIIYIDSPLGVGFSQADPVNPVAI